MSEKNYTFVFTEQEANQVLNALGALPFNQVQQLIMKIQRQATEQMTSVEMVKE
jgi:hypothetical protein